MRWPVRSFALGGAQRISPELRRQETSFFSESIQGGHMLPVTRQEMGSARKRYVEWEPYKLFFVKALASGTLQGWMERMRGSVGPLELADDTRWWFFKVVFSKRIFLSRSEASDPGGVAGATLVKIAIFSVNPVTKTGPASWECSVSTQESFMIPGQKIYMMHIDKHIHRHMHMQMMHMLLRPEDVHDAHAALALPPHHSSYNPGEISDWFIWSLVTISIQNSITLSDLLMYQREVATIGSKVICSTCCVTCLLPNPSCQESCIISCILYFLYYFLPMFFKETSRLTG